MKSFYAVILAGGKGKRFWPASRGHTPKQFLPIVGDRPMIRQTTERLQPLIPFENIIVLTGKNLVTQVREVLPEVPPQNILPEPVGRNTGPSVAWAAESIYQRDNDAVLAILASDHVIGDENAFRDLLNDSYILASHHHQIVTLGIQPTRPETGYGYIHRGSADGSVNQRTYFTVESFVEKPNLKTAEMYLKHGDYFWNSGMFIFRASEIREEFNRLQPKIFTTIQNMVKSGSETLINELFPTLPDISIDYAVMEKSDNIVVFPVSFPWADVGSWSALYEHIEADKNGNCIIGDHVLIDSGNLLINSKARFVAAIGLRDLVIVDTPDALLVCRKDCCQKVGDVYKILSKNEKWQNLI